MLSFIVVVVVVLFFFFFGFLKFIFRCFYFKVVFGFLFLGFYFWSHLSFLVFSFFFLYIFYCLQNYFNTTSCMRRRRSDHCTAESNLQTETFRTGGGQVGCMCE